MTAEQALLDKLNFEEELMLNVFLKNLDNEKKDR